MLYVKRALVQAIAVGDQEILELPRVGRVELRLVVAAEEIGVVLAAASSPKASEMNLPRYGLLMFEDVIVRQIVRHADAALGFSSIHMHGGHHRDGHLHGRGVLVRHQPPRLLDARDREPHHHD